MLNTAMWTGQYRLQLDIMPSAATTAPSATSRALRRFRTPMPPTPPASRRNCGDDHQPDADVAQRSRQRHGPAAVAVRPAGKPTDDEAAAEQEQHAGEAAQADVGEHLELTRQDQPDDAEVEDLAGELERPRQPVFNVRAAVLDQQPDQHRQQYGRRQGSDHSGGT